MSDLTLLSKVSNEAINENLKKRFEHGEIYVWLPSGARAVPTYALADNFLWDTDIHRSCPCLCEPI